MFVWLVGKFTFEPITAFDTYSSVISQLMQIGFGAWLLLIVVRDNEISWKNDVRFLDCLWHCILCCRHFFPLWVL